MNYQNHYDLLIERARNRSILKSVYKEVHHIIPVCIGGSNNKNNLVPLFPEEHLIAHLLLHKIHPNNYKLLHAANCMTNGLNPGNRNNNKKYRWLKEKQSKEQSKWLKENHFTKSMTDEEKKNHYSKISEINKVKYKQQLERQGGHWTVLKSDSKKSEIYEKSGIKQSQTKSSDEFKAQLSKTLKQAFTKRDQNSSKNPNAKLIKIYNNDNEVMFESIGEFKKICDNNNLPFQALTKSYKNDGKKLYQSLDKSSIGRLIKKGYYIYKGWYAIKVD